MAVGVALDAADRIVGPKPAAHGESEDRTEQAHCAGRGSASAVTRASPCLPVLMRAAVSPSVTASRNRSMSLRVTDATLSQPSRGLMWRSMRPLSVASVLGFLVACAVSGCVRPRQLRGRRRKAPRRSRPCALPLGARPDRRPSRLRRECAAPPRARCQASTARRGGRSCASAAGRPSCGI